MEEKEIEDEINRIIDCYHGIRVQTSEKKFLLNRRHGPSTDMDENLNKTDPIDSSFSIQTLEEIIRNYKRNEQYIHELVRNTRHERKKVEHILQQIYQITEERNKQNNIKSKLKRPKSIEFYVPFDNNDSSFSHRQHNKSSARFKSSSKKSILKDRENKSISSTFNDTFYPDRSTTSINTTQRVRFNIPDRKNLSLSSYQLNESNLINDKLSELEHRCKDLLSHLEIYQNSQFHHSNSNIPVYSHYRNNLNGKHECNNKINDKCQQTHPFSRSHRFLDDIHQQNLAQKEETKQISQNIYKQSFKLIDRLRQNLMNDNMKLRDSLREEILQLRLRQNALLYGRKHVN